VLQLDDLLGSLQVLLLGDRQRKTDEPGVGPLAEEPEIRARDTEDVGDDVDLHRNGEVVDDIHFALVRELAMTSSRW